MQENSENLNNQAILLAQSGEFSEAVACMRRAIAIDKENYLLWFNLGVMYRSVGDLDGAKNALLRAANLNDKDAEVLESLALVCYSREENEDAMLYYVEALNLNDQSAQLWNNFGVLLFSQGDYASACDAFERAVTIFPHYYDALFNLRDTYLELNNATGAAICDERLKKLPPPQN